MPVVHKLGELYKSVYALGPKLSKRDRYGIYLRIENLCISALAGALEAALVGKEKKAEILRALKLNIELLKQLIRIAHELKVIDDEKYLRLQSQLQEISKMVTGWLRYAT